MLKTNKLVRKIMILGVLLTGLAAIKGDLVTKAEATTCEDCESRYAACSAQCWDYQSACPILCDGMYNRCVQTCT
jgi:hypothetical protein